jgi:hypothetical protein
MTQTRSNKSCCATRVGAGLTTRRAQLAEVHGAVRVRLSPLERPANEHYLRSRQALKLCGEARQILARRGPRGLWSARCVRASGGELEERGAQRPADVRLVTAGCYSPVAIGQLGDSGALDEGLGKADVNVYRHESRWSSRALSASSRARRTRFGGSSSSIALSIAASRSASTSPNALETTPRLFASAALAASSASARAEAIREASSSVSR